MAEAIAQTPKEAHTADDQSSSNAAVEKLVRLLEVLDASGTLDVLLATMEQRGALLDILLNEAEKPGTVAAVKNVIAFGQMMSHVQPDVITALTSGFTEGLENCQQGITAVPVNGIWDVLKASRDPDVSRAFSAILTVLKAMGGKLRESEG